MSQATSATSFEAAFSVGSLAQIWEDIKNSKKDLLTGRVKIPRGWDGVGLQDFESQRDQHLRAIQRKAISGRYTFRPFLFHMRPKADGGHRKIAYSGIRDRIVQAALHKVLAPAIDAQLTDSAYAYREGRGAHDAIRDVFGAATQGRPYFVKSDFVQFFDRLDHSRLEQLLNSLPVDPRARQLAWRFARTGDLDRSIAVRVMPPGRTVGVPQGGVVSGILANLYLVEFDRFVRLIPGATLIRYADDFVVLCPDEASCAEVFTCVQTATSDALLELHAGAKTVACGHVNDGLNFVGVRLRGTRVAIKPSNVTKFQRRIDSVLARHESKFREGAYASADECIRQAVYHVNRKITGVEIEGLQRSWMTFFYVVNDVAQIRRLDRWIWRRLADLCQRLRVPRRRRSEMLALGYHSLHREYWRVRRRLRARALPFSGFLPRVSAEEINS